MNIIFMLDYLFNLFRGVRYNTAKVKVATFVGAGKFQHGVQHNKYGKNISEQVVDALEKVNEMAWDEMPIGSTGLEVKIIYKFLEKN